MSFGYGIGDIIAVTKLAWDTVQNARKACGEFDELTQEVASFHTVLQGVEDEAKKPDCLLLAIPDNKLKLKSILLPCRTVLDTLNQILEKYNALPSGNSSGGLAIFCQSVRFGNGEMQDLGTLRTKMTAGTSSISAFLNTLQTGSLGRLESIAEQQSASLSRIEQMMNGELRFVKLAVNEEVARLQAAPVSGREGSILTNYGDDDKAVWKEFRRSLVNSGFNSKIIEKNKETILGYIMEIDKGDVTDDSFETSSSITLNSGFLSTGNAVSSETSDVKFQRRKRVDGYRRCRETVMGLWANGTLQKFRASELRFEVIFQTPVFFTARPTNHLPVAPLRDTTIRYIDGTSESYKGTWTVEPREERKQRLDSINRVHSPDDARASWVVFLSTLQLLERESRTWEAKHQMTRGRVLGGRVEYPPPQYTLSVALQKKTTSWDFMPPSINRPFAQTYICHVVEMVAMLGMFWKSFDQKTWQIHAEGNGFVLTSSLVDGLGLMVNFAIVGPSHFEENRIIPTEFLREICFGSVTSIFTDNIYPLMKILRIGNDRGFRNRTLELLGCGSAAIMQYEHKHEHMFSLAFEIIGMLAVPIRIHGSNFKRLPNPTTDHFVLESIHRCVLLERFQSKLSGLFSYPDLPPNAPETTGSTSTSVSVKKSTGHYGLDLILKRWERLQRYWPERDGDLNLDNDLDLRIDIYLREALHDALDVCEAYLLDQALDSVLSVVSSHLSFVLEELNSPSSRLSSLRGRIGSEQLIDIYFSEILPEVISKGPLAANRADFKSDHEYGVHGAPDNMGGGAEEVLRELEKESTQRKDIWCVLVFRMLCWLLLHDFDEADINIVPSELKGSLMPVYIG